MQTAVAGGIDTKNYFLTEKHLIDTLLIEQSTFVVASSITAMSFFQGNHVDFEVSQGYLTEGSNLFDTKQAIEYRILVQYLRNSDKSATLIKIQTTIDPDSEAIVPFIKRVRATLVGQTAGPVVPALPVNMYLLGGYCSTYDIQVRKKADARLEL